MRSRHLLLLAVFLTASLLPRAADAPDLKKLLQDRVEVARKGLKTSQAQVAAGQASMTLVVDWSRRLLRAELALADKKADRVAARERYLEILKEAERMAKARHDAGRASPVEYLEATYERQSAEIALAREKARKDEK
jgi:outer membrane protein TolC